MNSKAVDERWLRIELKKLCFDHIFSYLNKNYTLKENINFSLIENCRGNVARENVYMNFCGFLFVCLFV